MVTSSRPSWIRFASCIAILSLSFPALAQKNSAAKKGTEPASQSSSKPATPEDTAKEDPIFKGMKYRLVGPFRGGRALTASGI
ncbi:MAG TPA: hypothetical protein VK466_08015, partial [Terriglobales bacterium]|nr:hypothetical protein [Terriglobales bacterium]